MIRILNAEPAEYSPEARAILEDFAEVDEHELTQDELREVIHNYEAVIVRLGHTLDESVFKRAERLEAVATATTGLNHIDVDAATRHDIEVICLKGEREFLDSIYATAEHTLALLLSVIRKVPGSAAHVEQGGWDRDSFKGQELHGRTLGIIGLGRNGSKLARYGHCFGMDVIAYDPYVSEAEDVQFVGLDELLTSADYVSLHVPHNEETGAMIGRDELNLMKSTAYLINTSRGEIIDEDALYQALIDEEIGGAGLDVLCGENTGENSWTNDSRLISYAANHQNVIVTPHIGGATYESMKKTEIFIANKLRNYFCKS